MTRLLSFAILFLHVVSDIRRRVTLLMTATCLAAVAIVIITFSVASASHAANLAQQHIAQPEPHLSSNASSLPSHRAALMPSLVTGQPKTISDTGAPTPSASPTPETPLVTPGPNQTVTPSPAQPSPAPSSIHATVRLSQPTTACVNGLTVLSITSAQLVFDFSPNVTEAFTWYWEIRTDSGAPPSQPVISNAQVNQVADGTQSIVNITNGGQGSLLDAPESTGYAYSFRLHVVLNSSDITSDWTSMPSRNDVSCSS